MPVSQIHGTKHPLTKFKKKEHVYVTFAYEVISQHHWLKWSDHICLQFTSIYSDTDSSPLTYTKFKLHKWRNTVPYRLLPCNLAYKPLQEISQAAICRCYFKYSSGKHLFWSFFLIKLQAWRAATLLKGDSDTSNFCEHCENFKNSFFYRTPPLAASEISKQTFPFCG